MYLKWFYFLNNVLPLRKVRRHILHRITFCNDFLGTGGIATIKLRLCHSLVRQ